MHCLLEGIHGLSVEKTARDQGAPESKSLPRAWRPRASRGDSCLGVERWSEQKKLYAWRGRAHILATFKEDSHCLSSLNRASSRKLSWTRPTLVLSSWATWNSG